MSHRVVLSNVFNMSSGFIPVIVTLILCEFLTFEASVYIGTAVGLLLLSFLQYASKAYAPNFILHICTAVLLLFSLYGLTRDYHSLHFPGPIAIEAGVIVPLLIIYLFRHRVLLFYRHKIRSKNRCNLVQGAESAMVAIRILLIFAILHLAALSITQFFSPIQAGSVSWIVLFHIAPPLVFILCILFNQYGLNYFNKVMNQTKYIAVVDEKGNVTGKILRSAVNEYKNQYTNAVIRIVPISNGMIFLNQRSVQDILDGGKTDTPFETFLYYKESIEEGMKRVLKETLPGAEKQKPRFALKYILKNEETSRLVYLFVLDIKDDAILCDCRFGSGKLWTLPQIEQNIGSNYFSTCFENEYDLLKEIIDTRERYKES